MATNALKKALKKFGVSKVRVSVNYAPVISSFGEAYNHGHLTFLRENDMGVSIRFQRHVLQDSERTVAGYDRPSPRFDFVKPFSPFYAPRVDSEICLTSGTGQLDRTAGIVRAVMQAQDSDAFRQHRWLPEVAEKIGGCHLSEMIEALAFYGVEVEVEHHLNGTWRTESDLQSESPEAFFGRLKWGAGAEYVDRKTER